MLYLIIVFVCGSICGACFGAITMAAVSSARRQAMPLWSDYWPPTE